MPISASAKKSLRQARTKYAHNVNFKVILKKAIKQVSGDTISDVFSKIDKAQKLNILNPNKASRLKSTISKQFKDIKPSPKSTAGATVAKKTKSTSAKKITEKSTKADTPKTTTTSKKSASPKKTK